MRLLCQIQIKLANLILFIYFSLQSLLFMPSKRLVNLKHSDAWTTDGAGQAAFASEKFEPLNAAGRKVARASPRRTDAVVGTRRNFERRDLGALFGSWVIPMQQIFRRRNADAGAQAQVLVVFQQRLVPAQDRRLIHKSGIVVRGGGRYSVCSSSNIWLCIS
jgi:hypothetical protein